MQIVAVLPNQRSGGGRTGYRDPVDLARRQGRGHLGADRSHHGAGGNQWRQPVEIDAVDGTLRIRRAATPTPVGIVLDDPANESLPNDPNDPRIVDADGDGQPGITVTIKVSPELTGELYIARREVFAWEALLTDPDRLDGTVTDDSEQLVIGASDPIFASSDANWAQFRDPARNPIILQRVDADWDCARLAAERDALFPPTPVVDW